MNRWSYFFLVTLRLVIGWHFLVEGYQKFHSHQIGETSTNRPWTGEPFFREGYGPAAQTFRDLLGDPDKLATARLRGDGQTLPTPVAAEWDGYFDRFVTHYRLTDDQRAKAAAKLTEAKKDTSAWLTAGQVEVTRSSQFGPVAARKTVPQWLAELEAKRQQIQDVYDKKLPAFNEDVEGARLRALKSEAAGLRDDLLAALDEKTEAMKASLAESLTPEQKQTGAVPDVKQLRPIDYVDRATMWAHMILGGCLLLGLFSRLASFLLALFLLSVILIAPAVPFAPTPPGATGHYLYINLYVIELVALLLLASTPTGRWFGLDALLGYFFAPRRRAVPVGEMVAAGPARRPSPANTSPRRLRG
jgi:uncharacterized membrane protein YphA (DoxX/SURF4 family)